MTLFARVAKLGFRAYGERHARVRPSVMQCVFAVRETVVIKPSRLNAEQVKYRGTRLLQFPPTFPPLALTHTSLKKERSCSIYT